MDELEFNIAFVQSAMNNSSWASSSVSVCNAYAKWADTFYDGNLRLNDENKVCIFIDHLKMLGTESWLERRKKQHASLSLNPEHSAANKVMGALMTLRVIMIYQGYLGLATTSVMHAFPKVHEKCKQIMREEYLSKGHLDGEVLDSAAVSETLSWDDAITLVHNYLTKIPSHNAVAIKQLTLHLRTVAIFSLLLTTGARGSEIIDMRVCNMALHELGGWKPQPAPTILLKTGKVKQSAKNREKGVTHYALPNANIKICSTTHLSIYMIWRVVGSKDLLTPQFFASVEQCIAELKAWKAAIDARVPVDQIPDVKRLWLFNQLALFPAQNNINPIGMDAVRKNLRDMGLATRNVTHVGRKTGARAGMENGGNAMDLIMFGHWAGMGAADMHYTNDVAIGSMLSLVNGYDDTKSFTNPRVNMHDIVWEPLVRMLVPELARLKALGLEMDAVCPKARAKTKISTLHRFADMLEWMARETIVASVFLWPMFPTHPLFCMHPLFRNVSYASVGSLVLTVSQHRATLMRMGLSPKALPDPVTASVISSLPPDISSMVLFKPPMEPINETVPAALEAALAPAPAPALETAPALDTAPALETATATATGWAMGWTTGVAIGIVATNLRNTTARTMRSTVSNTTTDRSHLKLVNPLPEPDDYSLAATWRNYNDDRPGTGNRLFPSWRKYFAHVKRVPWLVSYGRDAQKHMINLHQSTQTFFEFVEHVLGEGDDNDAAEILTKLTQVALDVGCKANKLGRFIKVIFFNAGREKKKDRSRLSDEVRTLDKALVKHGLPKLWVGK